MISLKKIKALIFLGIHFALHIIKKLFRIDQRKKADFLNAYKEDNIYSIDPKWREQMPDFSSCFHCHICDVYYPNLNSEKKMSPSYLVGSFSRSLTDFNVLDEALSTKDYEECEKHCPQNVPICGIVEFMKEKKELMEKSR